MNNETITVEQLEDLRNKLGRHSQKLNQQYRVGSRTAIVGTLSLNLMEVAALEVALQRLIQSIPHSPA